LSTRRVGDIIDIWW